MQSIMDVPLEGGMRNWEKKYKKKAARGRDQSRETESEDTLLCCARLSNLTHTLLNGVLSRLNPTGPLYIAMNSLIQNNSMPESVWERVIKTHHLCERQIDTNEDTKKEKE